MPYAVKDRPEVPVADEAAAAALAWHDGNPIATIVTLIDDYWNPRVQLNLAEAAISEVFSRGWAPKHHLED